MNKILLVDIDGTIRKPKSRNRFIDKPYDQKIIDGSDKAVLYYHNQGWLIVGITNQAGVDAGYKNLESCIAEQTRTLKLCPQLQAIYFCPDFEGKKCYKVQRKSWEQCPDTYRKKYRKPNSGMLRLAIADYNGDFQTACYIGDRDEDEATALDAGIKFLSADVWRSKFTSGVKSFQSLSQEEVLFLQSIEL